VTVEIRSAVAAGAVRNHSPSLQTLPPQLTNLKNRKITAPNRMHVKARSIGTNSIRADVDDGNELKMQLDA
jgi:hypothetical protein